MNRIYIYALKTPSLCRWENDESAIILRLNWIASEGWGIRERGGKDEKQWFKRATNYSPNVEETSGKEVCERKRDNKIWECTREWDENSPRDGTPSHSSLNCTRPGRWGFPARRMRASKTDRNFRLATRRMTPFVWWCKKDNGFGYIREIPWVLVLI